jgi:hypothetical protein
MAAGSGRQGDRRNRQFAGRGLRLDCINQFGPTDAWVTLDTVMLTNTSQLYFDVSAPGQPPRLYRLLPMS